MKKILLLAFAIGLFASCAKDENLSGQEESNNPPATGTLVASAEQSSETVVSLDELKSNGLGAVRLNFTMTRLTNG